MFKNNSSGNTTISFDASDPGNRPNFLLDGIIYDTTPYSISVPADETTIIKCTYFYNSSFGSYGTIIIDKIM